MSDPEQISAKQVHRPHPRGSQGLPPRALYLFGLPFTAVGILVMGIGSGRIPVGDELNVPGWIVVWIGGLFAAAGIWVSVSAWFRRRRLARIGRVGPSELHLVDRKWDPTGTFDETAPTIRKRLVAGVALIVFLVPFHGILLFARERGEGDLWVPYIAIGLFDLIIVLLLVDALVRIARRLRHGRRRLRFASFPFRPGRTLSAVLEGGSALAAPVRPEVTLRCIRERRIRRRHDDSPSIVYDLLHEQKAGFEASPTGECPISFTLPADAPGNRLHADQPVYWELLVRAKVSGPDYEGTFLLPVYDGGG